MGKKFATLPGIDNETVEIDLKQKQVVFTGNRFISQTDIETVLKETKFNATSFEYSAAIKETQTKAGTALLELARISFTTDQIGTELADDLLDVLGETAYKGTGRFVVTAPLSSESDILNPLIAGRQRAIPVRYIDSDNIQVSVILYKD